MSSNFVMVRRELLWLLIGLVMGLLLLPPLIWLVGSRVFGPYAGGNTRDLVDHFYHGLGQGQQATWIVALGPYLVILVLRLTVGAVQAVRRQA
ncbi:MAG TPA: hypothetical protein VK727_21045 [Steroidobacteraceae bacterium]|nr:hypothetical protein [Steroidobacteraceae bacterium]